MAEASSFVVSPFASPTSIFTSSSASRAFSAYSDGMNVSPFGLCADPRTCHGTRFLVAVTLKLRQQSIHPGQEVRVRKSFG